MSLIYLSTSSPLAESFSKKIAAHCESFLGSECILPKSSEKYSQQKIRSEIENCDVLMVIVCAEQSNPAEDVSEYNLIDNEQVRHEIISAMNQDILIVPVLIDDAKLPEKGNVPGALKKLLDCKSHHLRTVFWSEDMEVLLEHLEDELGFISEVKQRLTESVEVNYQRLAEFDGREPKKNKLDLKSSDVMQVQKMVEAETIFLQKARGIGDKKAEKNALSALALAYSRLGQTGKAIQYFQDQLVISQELGDVEEVCGLLANLGDAYAISGNIDRAKNFYEEQRVLAESRGLHAFVGTSYNGIGFVYVKKGKIEKAIDCYFKALASYRELEDHDKQLELLVGIGLNYRKLEQFEKAIECLLQALDIAKYLENRKEEIHIRVDLAESYSSIRKWDHTRLEIEKAREHLKVIKTDWSIFLKQRLDTLDEILNQ